MKNKNFEPDPNEHQFTITLKVYKNCQTMTVSPGAKKEITYQEVMGAIELSKLSQFTEQNIENMKKWIETKELQIKLNT